jgi:FAD/FMN-containing dehydrogenase
MKTDTLEQAAYETKKQRLAAALQDRADAAIRLNKNTSNLFRSRRPAGAGGLDVSDFNRVIRVCPEEGFVETEGMSTYRDLAVECLRHDVMPTVVPQLQSITAGGAVSGIGIESSSFQYGLVHETVRKMEILLADGSTVLCTPENEHSRLFFGFPNSYGTLGYVLKLRIGVVPVKPYVRLSHIRYRDPLSCFAEMERLCQTDIDFIDGTVFGPDELYLTVGEFTDSAPYCSDYTYRNIYYRSIRERPTDYLRNEDYIWRWDTDWFWCSQYVFAENPIMRRLLGPKHLNSVTYAKIMRWNRKYNPGSFLDRLRSSSSEAVIQDVEIPLEHCADFLKFYFSTIKFTPVWMCPVRSLQKNAKFSLYPLDPETLYVNFGFWNVIRTRPPKEPGHYNRLVEKQVCELGGMKSLYSDSYYSREEFWDIFDRKEYRFLKKRYDPDKRFKDLYEKCVARG